MELEDVIKKRYSVRGYKNTPVDKEKIDKILEAGRLAPTGVNYQAFKIFVIDTEKNKEALSEIYPQPWFTDAPTVLCVAIDFSRTWKRPWDGKDIGDIDAAIVMTHMILTATDLGLGTCFIGAFDNKKANEFLELKENYEAILFSPLGYPDDPGRKPEKRKIEDLVIYK